MLRGGLGDALGVLGPNDGLLLAVLLDLFFFSYHPGGVTKWHVNHDVKCGLNAIDLILMQFGYGLL